MIPKISYIKTNRPMVKQHFHQAKTFDQKPIVLIIGDKNFIGYYLSKFLDLKNCLVITTERFIKKEISKPDYIFCLFRDDTGELEKILDLAENSGARLLIALNQNLAVEKIIRESLQTRKINWRITHFGFVYGPRMSLKASGELTSLIESAVTGSPIKIPGGGSETIYPSFISDMVYGLMKAMFSLGTSSKIYTLIDSKGITLLDFAQLLKDKSLKSPPIEFVSESYPGGGLKIRKEDSLGVVENIQQTQANLGWKAKIGFEEGIEQTLAYFEEKTKALSQKVKKKLKKKVSKKKKKIIKQSILFFIPIFLLLLYPLVSFAFNGWWGIRSLKAAYRNFEMADFNQTVIRAQNSQKSFNEANQKLQWFSFFFSLSPSLEKQSERIVRILILGDKMAGSVAHAGLVAQSATKLFQIVFQDQSRDIDSHISEIKTGLNFVYDRLSLVEAEIVKEENFLPIKVFFGPEVVNFLSQLSEARRLLLKANEGIEILPEIIGVDGRRVYLILLQNNMELRPTGGFIGSYALAVLNEGRLIDFIVEDVYATDGQLKGHVEPPEEIKRYLGEAGWYLRDSNWHPDFPVSASRAEWFLEKGTGQVVDGVVGVNLFFAQDVLKQIGEVKLSEFNEKINYQNLFERAEYHSETSFFPGSTQKKDFLGSLSRNIFEKLKSSDREIWLNLAQSVYTSLKEKEIVVYLHHPAAMKIVSSLGWDGGIRGIKCLPRGEDLRGQAPSAKCFVDYLMIVEANVGVNKANYFVKRAINHQVEINQEGQVEEVLQIQYQNQSQSENFPAGRYKNYLRVLVPLGAELEEVTIDGQKVEEEKIDINEVSDKTNIGFLVEVPIKEEGVIEVKYRLAEKVDLDDTVQFILLLQKQSGIKDKVFNLNLTVPEGTVFIEPEVQTHMEQVVKEKPTPVLNSLNFRPEFNQDLVFEVGLGK